MPYFNWKDHQIFYREQGKGPLLLILPGNTASSKSCQGEIDYFSNRYHTASLDFLGTGKSDRVAIWAQDWWVDGASQAKTLVEHLGFEGCIAMGTSGGGAAALLMAIHFPEMVRAVIADSCVEQISKAFTQKHLVGDRNRRTAGQVQFWEFANGSDWEQVVEADTAMLLRFVDQGSGWFAGRLSEIQCPVLLTASKQDDALPKVARQIFMMSEQIADCRMFLNNSGRHPLMWSSPQDFRSISDYFLKTVSG
jgi:pimeloyl-ACP methyl ester carboxylesterase